MVVNKRKILQTLIRHVPSHPYLETTLHYSCAFDWLTNNESTMQSKLIDIPLNTKIKMAVASSSSNMVTFDQFIT